MISDHRVLSCCMIVSRYDMYVVFQTVESGKDDW